MAIAWPDTLPQIGLRAGSRYQPVSNATPIPVEAGEMLTRSRFTGDMANVTTALLLSETQAQTLLAFWRYDLKTGALPFLWDDPITAASVEMQFMSEPAFEPLGGRKWRASLQLRTKPM